MLVARIQPLVEIGVDDGAGLAEVADGPGDVTAEIAGPVAAPATLAPGVPVGAGLPQAAARSPTATRPMRAGERRRLRLPAGVLVAVRFMSPPRRCDRQINDMGNRELRTLHYRGTATRGMQLRYEQKLESGWSA
jgi:hypothetical protein